VAAVRVRGLRIRVTDALDLLASGLSSEQVLDELPDLEAADVLPASASPADVLIIPLSLRDPLAR